MRDVVEPTGRDLGPFEVEVREYPYTYPFYYSSETLPRTLSEPDARDINAGA